MKKIVFCALASFAAHLAFGGYAWYSEEINAILAKMPAKYYTKVNATLYGFFYKEIWSPPYAVYDSTTGKFYITDGSSFNVTSYATLNEYGKYNTKESLDSFFENCGKYVIDEFGSKYTIYDDNMASFYAEYEASNMAVAREAFNSLESSFVMWKNDVISKTTEIGVDVSKITELTKEIDESLGKAKDEIKKAVDDTKAAAEKMNNELAQVQEDLTKISEEAVYNAQKQINNAVNDFNSFITSLENAISNDKWDDTMFEDSFNELTKSEQDLVDAIKQLQQSSQDQEVQNAITILGGQLTGIRSLKTSLRAAIDAKDMDAARGVLNAARGMSSLYNSRAAISKVNNRVNELKSKADVLGVLAKAALSTMSEQDDFEASIGKLRAAFSAMFITAMDNFHQMNAYLGSTNSMAYVIKRESANDLADFTIAELDRWVRISSPDKIDDAYGFGASQFGGRRWNFIYDNLASTYMTWAWPLMELNGGPVSSMYKFMEHFNLTGASPKYKGFTEEYSELSGRPETNWVAKGITAPKNWADGKTIIVTNGHYVAVGGSGARVDNASITTNTIYGAVANGNASVYGFSTAENGSLPYKTAEGRVGWVTNSVDGGGLLMLKIGDAPSTVDIIAGYGMKVTKQSGAIQISSTLDTPDSAGAFSSITYISNIEYDTETHSLKVTKTTVSAKILNDGTSQEQTVFIATPHSAEHPSELKR